MDLQVDAYGGHKPEELLPLNPKLIEGDPNGIEVPCAPGLRPGVRYLDKRILGKEPVVDGRYPGPPLHEAIQLFHLAYAKGALDVREPVVEAQVGSIGIQAPRASSQYSGQE